MRQLLSTLLLLLLVTLASRAQTNFNPIWGKSADQVRANYRTDATWKLVDEATKNNLRILVYQNLKQDGLKQTFCFEDNALNTIKIERDPAKCLAPLPQGIASTTEQDTWRDETNNVVTQRRFQDNILTDWMLPNWKK